MSANTAKPKLAPLVITITDQRVLRRIHKAAGQYELKPPRFAKTVLSCGIWEWIQAAR